MNLPTANTQFPPPRPAPLADAVANWSNMPVPVPGGSLLPHMSARARTQTVDALFKGCGGYDRALQWIEANDDNYGKFFVNIWAKGVERVAHVEHGMDDGMEAALARLDARAPADPTQAIDAEFSTLPADLSPSSPHASSDSVWGDPIPEVTDD